MGYHTKKDDTRTIDSPCEYFTVTYNRKDMCFVNPMQANTNFLYLKMLFLHKFGSIPATPFITYINLS